MAVAAAATGKGINQLIVEATSALKLALELIMVTRVYLYSTRSGKQRDRGDAGDGHRIAP